MAQKSRGTAPRVKIPPPLTGLKAIQAEREEFDAQGLKAIRAHKNKPYFPPDRFTSWDIGNRALGNIVESLKRIYDGEVKRQPGVEVEWSLGTVRSHGDIRYPVFLGATGRENTRLMTHGFYSNGWTSHGTVKGCIFNFEAYRLETRLWGFTQRGDLGASKYKRLHFKSKSTSGLTTGRKPEEFENLRLAKLESGLVNLFRELADSYSPGYTFDDAAKKTQAIQRVAVKTWQAPFTTIENRVEWYLKGVAPPKVVARVEAAMGGKVPTLENLKVLLKV